MSIHIEVNMTIFRDWNENIQLLKKVWVPEFDSVLNYSKTRNEKIGFWHPFNNSICEKLGT